MAFNLGIFFLSGFGVGVAMMATLVGLGFAILLWPLLSIGTRLIRNARS